MPVESFNGYRRNDDYFRDVPRFAVDGAFNFAAFGERVVGALGEEHTVISACDFEMPPAGGIQLSFLSTSANDTVGGTGINSLYLSYLDTSLVTQSEVIELNGDVAPVLSVATDIRFIQEIYLKEVGTLAGAAGTIEASFGGTVYSCIEATHVRSQSTVRMIPAGKRLLLSVLAASSLSANAAALTQTRLVTSAFRGTNYVDPLVWFPLASIGVNNNSYTINFNPPLYFHPGELLGMEHSTDKAATVTGDWLGVLENL